MGLTLTKACYVGLVLCYKTASRLMRASLRAKGYLCINTEHVSTQAVICVGFRR